MALEAAFLPLKNWIPGQNPGVLKGEARDGDFRTFYGSKG